MSLPTHGKTLPGIFLILSSMLFFSCLDLFKDPEAAGAADDESTGVLTGQVADEEGMPVPGVTARLTVLKREAVTGEDGLFTIEVPKQPALAKLQAEQDLALPQSAPGAIDTLVISYKGQRFYLKPLLTLAQEMGTLIMASQEIKGNIDCFKVQNAVRLSAEFSPAEPAQSLNAGVPLAFDTLTGDFAGMVYYHLTGEPHTYILNITGYSGEGSIAFSNYMLSFQHGTEPVVKGQVKLPEKDVPCDTCQSDSLSAYKTNIYSWGSMGILESTDATLIDIAVGTNNTVALTADGNVVSWDETGYIDTVNVLAGLSNVKAIAASQYCALALKEDGTVAAWGKGFRGNIPHLPLLGVDNVKAIAAGIDHHAFLKEDGTVVAWGDNKFGQTTVPAGLTNFNYITAGIHNSAAVKEDGTIVVWGEMNHEISDFPHGLTNPKTIAAGRGFLTALREDGKIVTWGSRVSFPLENMRFKNVAAGYGNIIGIKADGSAIAWGSNGNDQGIIPTGLSHVKEFASRPWHTFALKNDGTLVRWGNGQRGGQFSIPPGLMQVKAIAASDYHAVILKENGTVEALPSSVHWKDSLYSPTRVPSGLTGVKAIAAANYFTVALKEDGTVTVWGIERCHIGGPDYLENCYPIQAPAGLTNVKAISAGEAHGVALKEDGSVVAWGKNDNGQTDVPVGLSNVKEISTYANHTVALKEDGTVVSWGRNDYGQCDVPPGLANVKAIAAGENHSVAIFE